MSRSTNCMARRCASATSSSWASSRLSGSRPSSSSKPSPTWAGARVATTRTTSSMATACRSDGARPGSSQRQIELPAGDRCIAPARPAVTRSPRVVGFALVALTKPRIIELLLVTTVPAMLLAQRGMPSLRLVLVTLVGGTLAAGSANTINCYLDRDIDAVMTRTRRRPLVVNGHGTIKPWEALTWGIALGAAATLLLGLMVNWLAASLADTAILFYLFVYTLLLKRRSTANIVIGGAAGCFPVLVGWAAVTGTVSLPAIVLFAVILLWTPPHFWALAMKFRKDYAAANVPMLPVVASPATVARKILCYSYAMVAATAALISYAVFCLKKKKTIQ